MFFNPKLLRSRKINVKNVKSDQIAGHGLS